MQIARSVGFKQTGRAKEFEGGRFGQGQEGVNFMLHFVSDKSTK